MGRKKAYSYDPNHKARGKGRRRGNISTDVDATELTGSVTWYAPPTVPDGHQMVVIDGYTMGRTTTGNATPQYIVLPTSSAELINVVNRIPGVNANATTEAGAYAALASSDACYVASFGDSETTVDGLVLELDASKKVSYPSTGNTWYDLSGQNNNASLSNSPTYSTDGYIIFDGTNDYATISSDSSFNVNVRTVELTFKMNGSYSNFAPLAVYANGSSSTNRVWLGLQSSKFRMHGWGTSDPAATTTISADKWYTCVWTYDKSTQKMKMYTNGVLENDHSQTQSGVNGASGMNWYLAYMPGGSSWQGQTYSDVSIKSFKVYDKVLSDSEVKQNFYKGKCATSNLEMYLDADNIISTQDEAKWYDISGNSRDATKTGSPTLTTLGGAKCWNFTSTNQYFDYNNSFSNLTACTLEAWIYPAASEVSSGDRGTIIQGNIYMSWNKSNRRLSSYWYSTDNRGYHEPTLQMNREEWYHLCTVWTGTQLLQYVNGNLEKTTSTTISNGYINRVRIGMESSGRQFAGGIGMIKVYSGALTPQEISDNYNSYKGRFGR